MRTFTIQDIRDKNPCYDPAKFLPEDWTGTMVDILNVQECPAADRLWVASVLLDDKTLRLFAVACARRALELVDTPDPRSIEACNVAERFANGEATKEELDASYAAARAAVRDAAWVADAAAWSAADAASYAAAWAARIAARDAARDAEEQWQIETLIELCEELDT